MGNPLTNPKDYSAWEGKEHKEEDYQKLHYDPSLGDKGTEAKDSIHGPKPSNQRGGTSEAAQGRIKSDWPSSKEHKR